MQKAVVFKVHNDVNETWMELEYTPEGVRHVLAGRDDTVEFKQDNATEDVNNTKMGWQKSSEGYRLYFKTSANDAIDVADNGYDLIIGSGRRTDLTFAFVKYDPPADFGWNNRPRFRDGDLVEDGDKAVLTASYDPLTITSTGGYRKDIVTEHIIPYKPKDHWLAIFSNNPRDQVIWTVHKSAKNTTELMCYVDDIKGYVYLSSILESERDRCAMHPNPNWRDLSTAWKIFPKGEDTPRYSLFFESHPTTAVSQDCIIQSVKDAPPVYFTLDKYIATPPSFDWKDRPYATDGYRVQDGDRVAFRLNPPVTISAVKTSGDWLPTTNSGAPDMTWTFRKSRTGKINLECSIEGATYTWCVFKDNEPPHYFRSGFRTNVPEADASTRWTKSEFGGYDVHFESRPECEVYAAGILQPTKANRPAHIALERVK